MEAVKLRLFEELWTDVVNTFSLDASINHFLDYLQTKGELLAFGEDWYRLVSQNRRLLYDQLKATLVTCIDGYDIVMDYVKKDSLRFLYDKYTDRQRVHQVTQNEIDKALKYGNVPTQPKFFIERTSLMDKIKAQMLNTFQSNYSSNINIYGMEGSGKTNLIAACLRDPDVLISANYKVYWIDLNRVIENDLLDRMYKLYHKVQIGDSSLSYLPTDHPGNVDLMKERLLNLFTKDTYSKAIIVLDNFSPELVNAIEYFGVCRLVIVSQERIERDERLEYMPLQDTFTCQETMELFKMALERDPIPNEHLDAVIEWCRGDLTTVCLCANLMVERRSGLTNKENGTKVWKRFKEELCKKNSKITTKRNRMIELRLQSLSPEVREKYFKLAIFVTDVNITPNVLSLLWNMECTAVDDVMQELCNKSFAMREYNQPIDDYVYGINHNYLNYLRSKHPQLQHVHKDLIAAYRDKYMHYHKFTDDNYIYQYIGYHLHEAGEVMLEDFEIYRDLRFVEAKIRAAGIADTLRDYEIYHAQITRHTDVYERIVLELVEFIKRFGQNIEQYPFTDILQSALQLPADNIVHKLALQDLRCTGQFNLYFDWLSSKRNRPYIHQLSIKQNMEVACFTYDDPSYLLIGTATGDIQLWDPEYDKVLQEFKGHNRRVTVLRASEHRFLSISEDGTIKVWKLDNKSRRNSFVLNANNGEVNNIPSPAYIKQKNYQNFFANNFSADNCVTYAVEDDSLISADFHDDSLVAGSAKGKLILWQNDQQLFEKDLKAAITAVQFSVNSNYIYAALKSDVVVYDTRSYQFICKKCCKDDIISLYTLECDSVDEFIVVQEKQVLICSIKLQAHCMAIDMVSIMTNDLESNTCSSMTSKYLVIGLSSNRIIMWDLKEKTVIAEFDTQYGQVICMDAITNWNDHSIEILLTGFEDRSVKLWHINPEETSVQQAEKVDAFAAHWTLKGDFKIGIVRKNKLVILENNESTEIDSNEGDIVKIVSFNGLFLYGMTNGKVYLWNGCSCVQIMDLRSEISYLETLDAIVVAGTAEGKLFVYYKGSAHKLRGEGRDIIDEVRCSFIMDEELVVMSQRKISSWNMTFESETVLDVSMEGNLRHACIIGDDTMCVTFESSFKLIKFQKLSGDTILEIVAVKKTQSVITSCCFSCDSKYLALGMQNGDIEVFNTECLTLASVLCLHKSSVNYMKFAYEGPYLLSLSEQLAWWNVKLAAEQLENTPSRRSFRSRSNSRKSSGKKPPPLLNVLADMNLSDVVMLSKRGRFNKEYLLAAIKLHGMSASHVVCADRFRAFLCVDNLGNLYNLRMLEETLVVSPFV